MHITTKRVWILENGDKSSRQIVLPLPVGRHEVERIPNPLGHTGFWLVLKGTLKGMGEKAWRKWEEYTNEWQIVIED